MRTLILLGGLSLGSVSSSAFGAWERADELTVPPIGSCPHARSTLVEASEREPGRSAAESILLAGDSACNPQVEVCET